MCWTGKNGCIGICPNCGSVASGTWDPEPDVNTCTICGWTDAKDDNNNRE